MSTRSDLSSRISATIRNQRLFSSGDTLIIGLSGGADSTALLDLLANLSEIPLHLVAAHLNHCLRGAESDGDEEFCRNLAEQYKIPFESRRIDVKSIAEQDSLNLEDAGRRARIAFFDELRKTWQATAVVLAHHADDQAETVLMRLLRGSGMTGLAGMPYRNRRGYVRPLLGITRAEIEAHLIDRNLAWREDSSNRDTSFLRNRIRHELLPLLERYNPEARASLATTAGILSAENELLDELAEQVLKQACQTTELGNACSIKLLETQPLALQRRIIRLMLSRQVGNLDQFSYDHIDQIGRLVSSPRPHSMINLPQGILAVKEYDALFFKAGDALQPDTIDFRVTGPGAYQLPGNTLMTVENSPAPEHFDTGCTTTAYFDLDKAPFPWHVRTFLPGDRIQPLGMTGRKKLKDLFIDCKIPRSQRSRTPLIFCREELIWVCGLRTSQPASLDEKSIRTTKVVISRSDGREGRQLTCI